MIVIYGLVDPLVHQVAYIGKTNDIYDRWEAHVKTEADHLTGQWIKRLRLAGIQPVMIILETLPDDGDWSNAERWWIAHGLRIGWPLTNTVHTNGSRAEQNCNTLVSAVNSWEELNPRLITPERPRRRHRRAMEERIDAEEDLENVSSVKFGNGKTVEEMMEEARDVFELYYDVSLDALARGGKRAIISAIFGEESSTGGSFNRVANLVASRLKKEKLDSLNTVDQ